MTIQELFIRTNEELKKVVDQIKDDQWDIVLPAEITFKPANLKEAVDSHAYDDAWVPDVLAGKTKEEVGDAYDFILTATDTKATYAMYNQKAIDAVREFTDLEKIVHLSYGDFKAKEYLQHISCYRGFRVYDLAELIGADTVMATDLVEAMWNEYAPLVDDYRAMGVFPPAIDVKDDADLQTKLLALVGRQ